MEPIISDGDIISVNACPFEQLEEGDIVIYENDDRMLISHRIYKRTANTWHAKGDNNTFKDQTVVTRSNYRGLVYVEQKTNSPRLMDSDGRSINTIKRIVYTHSI
jgi:signal peptidase I